MVVFIARSSAVAWQARIVGSGSGPGDARAVVTTADGDVIAGGYIDQMGTGGAFTVVRLAAADGMERWRTVLPSPAVAASPYSLADYVAAVALDPAGNVIAVGRTLSAPNISELTAVKLDASTGTIEWRYDVPGAADAVAVDSAGDAFVGGFGFTAVKLAGQTGTPIWTVQSGPDDNAAAIAVLADGDVVVGSAVDPYVVSPTAFVTRLDGMTGVQRWRAQMPPYEAGVIDLAVTPADRIFTATANCRDTCNLSDVTVTRLSSTTGARLWQRVIPPAMGIEGLGALVPTPTGDVVAVVNSASIDAGRCLDPGKFRAVLVDGDQGNVVVDHTVAAQTPPSNSESCPLNGPVGYGAATTSSGSILVAGTFPIAARLEPPDLHESWRLEPQPDRVVPRGFTPSAVAANGRAIVAGSWLAPTSGQEFSAPQQEFSVLSLDATTGRLDACGDGIVDPNERCDDGNLLDGDCCSSDCTIEAPDGAACDDGDACTLGDACNGGICRGPTPLPCEPCGTCVTPFGCIGFPVDPCGRPTATDTAMLVVRRAHGGRRGEWRLRSGPATSVAALGDPRTATTGYAFCGYAAGRVLLRGTAPGGRCGHGAACWHRTRRGFVYDDPKAPDGLSHVAIRAGGAGHTRLQVAGHGPRLLTPSLPVDSRDIVVRLQRTDDPATCWTAEHTKIVANRSRLFRAQGD